MHVWDVQTCSVSCIVSLHHYPPKVEQYSAEDVKMCSDLNSGWSLKRKEPSHCTCLSNINVYICFTLMQECLSCVMCCCPVLFEQADPVMVLNNENSVAVTTNRLQEGGVPPLEQGMVVGQLILADALIVGNCNNQVLTYCDFLKDCSSTVPFETVHLSYRLKWYLNLSVTVPIWYWESRLVM